MPGSYCRGNVTFSGRQLVGDLNGQIEEEKEAETITDYGIAGANMWLCLCAGQSERFETLLCAAASHLIKNKTKIFSVIKLHSIAQKDIVKAEF